MIISKRKYIKRGNNIYFRLISLFKVDFAKLISRNQLDFAFQSYPKLSIQYQSLSFLHLHVLFFLVLHLNHGTRKSVFGVSNQHTHKPGCTATERRWRDFTIYVGKTKVHLICAFVYAYSHDVAHFRYTGIKLLSIWEWNNIFPYKHNLRKPA